MPVYITVINPFRRLIVYPKSCARSTRAGFRPSVQCDKAGPREQSAIRECHCISYTAVAMQLGPPLETAMARSLVVAEIVTGPV